MADMVDINLDKKGTFSAGSDDLLAGYKVDKKLLVVGKLPMRAEIELERDDKSLLAKLKMPVNKAVGDFLDPIEKSLDSLVKDLEKLVKEDRIGNKKAAGEAEKLVEATEKDIKKELPEFGKLVRKAVEKAVGKLPGNVKSHSSGGFKGLELKHKFEAGTGISDDFSEVLEDVGKLLEDASGNATKQCRALEKGAEKLEDAVEDAQRELESHESQLKKADANIARATHKHDSAKKELDIAPTDEKVKGEKVKLERQVQEAADALDDANTSRKDLVDNFEKTIARKGRALADQFESYADQHRELLKSLEKTEQDLENQGRLLKEKEAGKARLLLTVAAQKLDGLEKELKGRLTKIDQQVRQCLQKTEKDWKEALNILRGSVKTLPAIDAKGLEAATKDIVKET